MLNSLTQIGEGRTGRCSSWDKTGRNADAWRIPAAETALLAHIEDGADLTPLYLPGDGVKPETEGRFRQSACRVISPSYVCFVVFHVPGAERSA